MPQIPQAPEWLAVHMAVNRVAQSIVPTSRTDAQPFDPETSKSGPAGAGDCVSVNDPMETVSTPPETEKEALLIV